MDTNTLPKAELHVHLDGLPDPAMIRDIRRELPDFPVDPDTFANAYPVHDYDSFWRWWTYLDPIEGSLNPFYPVLGRHIARLKAQNVRYAEIMISSSEVPADPAEAIAALTALRAWVNGQEAGQLQVEFIIAFGRNRSPEAAAAIGERVLALYRAGLVVGVALAGPEPGNPVRPFQGTFARLHDAGLGIEIHAGEWAGPEAVWDALEYGFPDRIGHGITIFQDEKLLDVVRERKLHIEFCPTSNIKTGSVAHIEDHPVARARSLGLNYSISTDDPGPFECSIASEYTLLAATFGFSESDFFTIYTNALAARFQPLLRVPV